MVVNGRTVLPGSPKERLILTVLACSAGEVVPTQTLIRHVWGHDASPSIRSSVYSAMTRIRNRLRDAGAASLLVSRSQGYVLEIAPDAVDYNRVRRLYREAGARLGRGERRVAAGMLGQALALWEGEPLAEVRGAWADALRRRIGDFRLRVLARWAEAQTGLGEYEAVLERLADDADRWPGDGTLAYYRMRALAVTGRQAEAVECYNALREHSRRKSGSEPDERVQGLFHEILAEERRAHTPPEPLRVPRPREPQPPTGSPVSATAPGAPPVPAPPAVHDDLEADIPDFTAREAELAALVARAGENSEGAVVQVVEGAPGVGKSALALHAAHLLRNSFDTRLHVRLRGADGPADPAHVLEGLLRALGVPGRDVPAGVEARAALWRNLASRRRVLLLLDDAALGQAGPLLPGSPGCSVLVTARGMHADLDGAHRLTLGSPGPTDAARMFAVFSGGEPGAPGTDRLVSVLGGLPLGLRLAAARLRNHPTWTPGYLADRIARNGITEMRSGDRDLASVFDLAYRDLDDRARRAFLVMGVHPASDTPVEALAAVLGDQAERAMEDLLGAYLVEEPAVGLYRMHDLLRDFARQRAGAALSEDERHDVRRRLLGRYLGLADAADRAVVPHRIGRLEHPGPPIPLFEGARDARAWFSSCFAGVEAAAGSAHEHGFTEHAARIPLAVAGLLDTDGPWDRAEALYVRAVEAWRSLGGGPGLVRALYELGRVRWRTHDLPGAVEATRAALAEADRCGDAHGRYLALDQLGLVRQRAGDDEGALSEYRRALGGFRRLGEQRGVAQVYNHIGISQRILGRHDEADTSLTIAYSLYRALGDAHSEAKVRLNLAQHLYQRGYHRDALSVCVRGLGLFRESGDGLALAQALHITGLVLNYRERYGDALAALTEARELLRTFDDALLRAVVAEETGTALVGLGRAGEARGAVEPALESLRGRGCSVVEAQLLRVLGDIHAAEERLPEARLHLRSSRELARRGASWLDEGRACDRLGDLSAREGRGDEARGFWRQALVLLEGEPNPYTVSVRIKLELSENPGRLGS